jgi:hypothetical protein
LITLLVALYQEEYCIDYSVGGLVSGGSTVLITLLVVLYQGEYCIDYSVGGLVSGGVLY